jgi:hypothetical protein
MVAQLRLRRRGVALAIGAASAALLCAIAACSSSSPPPGNTNSEGGTVDVDVGEASARDRYTPPEGYDAGLGIGLADLADTPCGTRGGTLATLVDPDAGPPPAMHALAIAGSRRVSDTFDGAGLLFFDADGKNASFVDTQVSNGGVIATMGQSIVFAGTSGFSKVYARTLDGTGNGAPPIDLADEEGEMVGVGASDTEALVAWMTTDGRIRARGFANGTPKGDVFDFALGAMTVKGTIAVTHAGGGVFAAAFSGSRADVSQTAFGRAKDGARYIVPHDVFTGDVPRRTIGFVKVPTGYAMLVNADDEPGYALLVMLNDGGFPTRPAMKLKGTIAALGLAASASELVVVAARDVGPAKVHNDLAVEMRTFSLAGDPAGDWVCLDTHAEASRLDMFGAPVADGAGWSVVFRAADGRTALARVDHLGTGPL